MNSSGMLIRHLLLMLLSLSVASAHATDNLQAFPAAEPGMVRYVLQLPAEADESLLKIEVLVGKTVQVDPDNRYFFTGHIREENIPGWGFTRYEVSPLGTMAGTLMATDPKTPRVERFISLGGEPFLMRYNSRLPVVVYVPEGAEVRYRIWRANPQVRTMEKG